MSKPEQKGEEKRAPRWQAPLLVVLVVVIVGTVIARAAADGEEAGESGMRSSLTAEQRQERRESTWETVLPYITEGATAMFLGFLLALATRFAFKMAIFVLVLGFVGLQFLAYKGILSVDWGALGTFFKDNVLHVDESGDWKAIAQDKLPSAGAGLLGYLLGLKKG